MKSWKHYFIATINSPKKWCDWSKDQLLCSLESNSSGKLDIATASKETKFDLDKDETRFNQYGQEDEVKLYWVQIVKPSGNVGLFQ